jgi:hypothetical protein
VLNKIILAEHLGKDAFVGLRKKINVKFLRSEDVKDLCCTLQRGGGYKKRTYNFELNT